MRSCWGYWCFQTGNFQLLVNLSLPGSLLVVSLTLWLIRVDVIPTLLDSSGTYFMAEMVFALNSKFVG